MGYTKDQIWVTKTTAENGHVIAVRASIDVTVSAASYFNLVYLNSKLVNSYTVKLSRQGQKIIATAERQGAPSPNIVVDAAKTALDEIVQRCYHLAALATDLAIIKKVTG